MLQPLANLATVWGTTDCTYIGDQVHEKIRNNNDAIYLVSRCGDAAKHGMPRWSAMKYPSRENKLNTIRLALLQASKQMAASDLSKERRSLSLVNLYMSHKERNCYLEDSNGDIRWKDGLEIITHCDS